jgi:hypothetical protein
MSSKAKDLTSKQGDGECGYQGANCKQLQYTAEATADELSEGKRLCAAEATVAELGKGTDTSLSCEVRQR